MPGAAGRQNGAEPPQRGGNPMQSVTVDVRGPTGTWTATPSADWVRVATGHGSLPGQMALTLATADLPEGRHSAQVLVRASDDQTVSIPVSVEVLPAQFVLTSGSPSFTAVNGSPIPAQRLGFEVNNGVPSAWTASTTADWLLASPTSGTTPGAVWLQPDPTRGALAAGGHDARVLLHGAGLPTLSVNARMTLWPATLTAATRAVTLGGDRGRDLSARTVHISLNTGATAWPFTLSGLPDWLATSTPSGTVSQAGTTLSFTPRADVAPSGSSSATVTVTAQVNGDTVTLPLTVNLNLDARRLLPSRWGVGLGSTPAGAVLSRQLTVADNLGGDLGWTATSSAPWLQVTASGRTGSGGTPLVLTADPSAVPAGELQDATVTLSSPLAGVAPAVVRVSFWKDTTAPTTVTRQSLPAAYARLVADPRRPYLYAHTGGTAIDIFHAYTAAKIGTVSGVGNALGDMAVSPDGQTLYVMDTTTQSLVVVDLVTRRRSGRWSLSSAIYEGLTVVRPNGVDLVLVGGDGTGYVDGRRVLPLYSGPMGSKLTAADDGQQVFSLGARYVLDHSAMGGGMVFSTVGAYLNTASRGNLRDLAVSPDGTRAYSASGGGVYAGSGGGGLYTCGITDGADGHYIGALPGNQAYPNNVAVTAGGRVLCGFDAYYDNTDLNLYSATGALLRSFRAAPGWDRLVGNSVVILPDGLMAAGLASEGRLLVRVPLGGP
ncbi:BACON domain-containing protein [Ideonella livida]|uniref:BACON domain-containing protein n=1 Tax=Ideonella livida TaxID=2707176 RepID=A0A7C9PK36_9BURK|nr:hypothetical protein [Ideonella livida]NDY93669.1 hypothetical protein [Ideonella livida]